MLAPSKFRVTSSRNQREENRGCSKCDKKCDLCKNNLIQASKFQSSATGRQYPIQQGLSCSSRNVIYLTTCAKCNLQYVGSTSTEFKVRFRNHKSNMLKNKRTCELAIHFNDSEHEISQINFIIIEQIRSLGTYIIRIWALSGEKLVLVLASENFTSYFNFLSW